MQGVWRWAVPIQIDVVPNPFIDYGVFAQVCVVHMVM
jgi:hypothetical protein